ncbi:MAG: DUF86 domain-containing protein [Planctomycetes bacterium]|nr:DUF86 domain-containing protein [Planctomycetota bacterium]
MFSDHAHRTWFSTLLIKYSHIDWKGIVGLRNRIAHEYFDVSLDIIWHIIEKELPLLKNQIASILEKEKK